MAFVTINGLTFNVALSGNPAAGTVVLINSLGSDFRIWDEVVPHLADQYRILRFDKRGHGLSDSPPRPYTLQQLSRDVNGLLDHFHIEQAALVGVSVGGLIALDAAIRFPQRVSALVLCDTAAKVGTAAYWQDRIAAIETQGLAALADMILSRWFAPDFAQTDPATYRGFLNLLTRTDVNGYLGTCEALRDADLREEIAAIRQPALVLCGAEDTATPPALVSELAAGLRYGRFLTIPQAGHTPSVEQPAAISGMIKQFLQEQTDIRPLN